LSHKHNPQKKLPIVARKRKRLPKPKQLSLGLLGSPTGREPEALIQAGPGDEIREMKQEEIDRRRRLDEQRDRLRK